MAQEREYSEREIREAKRKIARQFRQSIDQVMDWEAREYLKRCAAFEQSPAKEG